jgi:hypothetical protein
MEKKWEAMSPDEKQEAQFQKLLNPKDPQGNALKFQSSEAEASYKASITRIKDAVQLKKLPDRVPVALLPSMFPFLSAGMTVQEAMYDYEKCAAAFRKFMLEFKPDMHIGAAQAGPGKFYEILDYKLYKWPGHGLADDAVMVQFDEKEYMRPDEYDEFILNPADYIIRRFLPRTWGVFSPMSTLGSLSSFQGIAYQALGMASLADFRPMFKAIAEASKSLDEWVSVVTECSRATQAMGYPSTEGGMALAPFDTIADLLRGTRGNSLDMYRRPDKLLEAIDKIVGLTLKSVVDNAHQFVSPFVFIPMHKGDDAFMSDRHFEQFYWPSFRKLLLGLIDEGLIPAMVVDGTYNRRLEHIKDLPRASVIWTFEKTDMALAKQVLGGHACIAGNITGALLYTGTPEDVKKYCRWLIDTCGPGGGYILSMGISVDTVDPANLQAIIASAKEYGVYRK